MRKNHGIRYAVVSDCLLSRFRGKMSIITPIGKSFLFQSEIRWKIIFSRGKVIAADYIRENPSISKCEQIFFCQDLLLLVRSFYLRTGREVCYESRPVYEKKSAIYIGNTLMIFSYRQTKLLENGKKMFRKTKNVRRGMKKSECLSWSMRHEHGWNILYQWFSEPDALWSSSLY